MAKKSQLVKEITQIVVFLVVVGILLLVFVIYPLGLTKGYLARPEAEEINPDSLPVNDISAFEDLPAAIDSFRIDADGLTNLACAYLTPIEAPDTTAEADTVAPVPIEPRGLAILVHPEHTDRTTMKPLAGEFLEREFAVCLYDQRASGRSTGVYHSDGEYEAADLAEVLAYLTIRELVPHPCVAVGYGAGGDAVLLEAATDERIDAAIAIEPYITSDRWINRLMEEHDAYWFPFSHTLFKFWYELRSGYAPRYRNIDNVPVTDIPTLILVEEDQLTDETLVKYLASAERARLTALPPDTSDAHNEIFEFLFSPDSGVAVE